ncbi:MAG: hypothetical protein ACO1SV_00785 [Fimbriimonas sp.]
MRTENTSILFTRPGLDEVVKLYNQKRRRFYSLYTGTKSTKHGYVQVATEGDFQAASEVNQAGGIDFQDFQTPYYMQLAPRKRAIGFSIATEELTSDMYGIIADKGPKMLAAIDKAKEYDAASFINLGKTSAVQTPDGLSFFNAAHLMETGTYSNILAGNPALSVTSLAAAKSALFQQPSHTGDPMCFDGDFLLLVHPDQYDLAFRLTNSDRLPGSGDNDPNWAGMRVRAVQVPYFSSPTAWALVVADRNRNPMKLVSRRGLQTKEQPDISKDAMLYTATEIWVKGAFDPRGIVFSEGA